MLILLPPSETKRPGGGGVSLKSGARQSYSELDETRRMLERALRDLAADPAATIKALKLGPKQLDEVAVNADILESPTMPAIERFTGVIYDAIDVSTLDRSGRDFLDAHLLIQSALFGLIRATDLIPAYRLSFDSRLPGVPALKNVWGLPSVSILTGHSGLILDLRSEGYAALSPLPERDDAFFVRAMGRTPDGTVRQLNHFNKKGKGVFIRSLASSFPQWIQHHNGEKLSRGGRSMDSVETLLDWAKASNVDLTRTDDPHVLQLVINEADYPPISARSKNSHGD
jgi:cytoplasmic iron level regulating protein YaaA (DUF328/UPF0246 family)